MSDKKNESVFTAEVKLAYLEPPPPETSFAEFKKVVESRRSVRVYDGTPIPEETTRECLRLALLAPTSSNLQSWEFFWVRSPEKKRALAEACLSQNAATTAAELIVCVARPDTWRINNRRMIDYFRSQGDQVPRIVMRYYEKLAPFFYTQGPLSILGFFKRVFFAIAGLFRPVPREPVSHADMRLWATKTTALACENLMLAFRAAGFDTCPMEGFDPVRVRKLLGLPRGHRSRW